MLAHQQQVEKTAASGATGAERIVEILERYPENVSILRYVSHPHPRSWTHTWYRAPPEGGHDNHVCCPCATMTLLGCASRRLVGAATVCLSVRVRRTVAAFEAWAKDPANIKLLATERVLAGRSVHTLPLNLPFCSLHCLPPLAATHPLPPFSAALVRAMRDPVRLSAAKEKADIDLARLITGMLALVTQEARAVRTIIRMGFLKDVVAIIASGTTYRHV